MNTFKAIFNRLSAKIPNVEPNGPASKAGSAAATVLAALGLGGYAAYNSMVTIQPGHAGVVYNRIGGLDEKAVLKEGLNFVIPFFQRAIVYDVRTRPQPIDTQSGSKG